MGAIRDYRDLDVWKLAMELAVEAYKLSSLLPRSERFELASQIRRSAVSVPSNIAEGYGRRTTAEYLRFLGIANGSLKELETQAILVERLSLLASPANQLVLALCTRMGQMLTALRRKLA